MLKFMASDRYLAGTYECTAVNGVGEPASAKIEISIICKFVSYSYNFRIARQTTKNALVHTARQVV